jgi:hypothetical protein
MKRLIKSNWSSKRLTVKDWDLRLEKEIVNPKEIEQEISPEMRYKEWHLGPKSDDPTTIVFTWVTQEPFDDESDDFFTFGYEVRRIAERVFKVYEDAEKVKAEVYVRDDRSRPQNWNTFEITRSDLDEDY